MIQRILQRSVKSILELTVIFNEWTEKEICKEHHYAILEMLNEPETKFDPEELQGDVERYIDNPLELFKQVGWQDREWKNNHCDSVKLFKEIISMNILEPSIIQPELNSIEDRTLSNEQLMTIFNYAECFLNSDSQLLSHYYDQLQGQLAKPKEPEEPAGK